jgi:hypothetical protein
LPDENIKEYSKNDYSRENKALRDYLWWNFDLVNIESLILIYDELNWNTESSLDTAW